MAKASGASVLEDSREGRVSKKVQSELESIERANGGELHPDAVWQWAKSHPRSALYQEFEWDKTKAAEAHWRRTAQRLIQFVLVRVHDDLPAIRKYVSVQSPKQSGRTYVTIQKAMSSDEMRDQLMAEAAEWYAQGKRRYQTIKQLAQWLDDGAVVFKSLGRRKGG